MISTMNEPYTYTLLTTIFPAHFPHFTFIQASKGNGQLEGCSEIRSRLYCCVYPWLLAFKVSNGFPTSIRHKVPILDKTNSIEQEVLLLFYLIMNLNEIIFITKNMYFIVPDKPYILISIIMSTYRSNTIIPTESGCSVVLSCQGLW